MLTKQSVTKAMQTLPAEFTIDELYAKLDLLFHVDAGIRDLENQRSHSHQSIVKEYSTKWRKLSGQKKR